MSLHEDLAIANHILFKQGVVDGFGHVSMRDPDRPDRFVLARSMAPALVTADDVMTFGLDGEALGGDGRKSYLERYIHSEIFRARPEVMAVVHSHSPAVIPFGLVPSVPLRPVCHMSGFIGDAAPVFEIRDYAGDASNLLVDSNKLGVALTDVLGSRNAVLMRGHGSTVVGASLQEAVFRGIYLEVNARLQSEALRLGEVTYLTAGEAATIDGMNRATLERAWGLWVRQAEG